MKAKLIFDLDNPEDKKAHKRCIKSSEMASFIWELQNNRLLELIDKEITVKEFIQLLNYDLESIRVNEFWD